MRTCVIGAGPCGLTAVKNLLAAGVDDVVCYDEHTGIGGNWAFTDDPGRASVHGCTRTISSRRWSSFPDFPMPEDYPDFPSHREMLAYFTAYARSFGLERYVHLGSRVSSCRLGADGRWIVRVHGEERTFDNLVVCTGHHRDPFIPSYPGTFTGTIRHSSAYKHPEPFRGQRVLVVGAGNSAADIAADLAGIASYTVMSVREGTYVVPKLLLGRPVDVVYAFGRNVLPKPLLGWALKNWLRLTIGPWTRYGLPRPATAPLVKPPTVNSAILAALRERRVTAVRGIMSYDGKTVQFVGGHREAFDAIVMATGFRASFPFLPGDVAASPLCLNMRHPTIPSLYFIGLFQPIGCIWRLADYQARIASLLISGRLTAQFELSHGIEVDYFSFERQLRRELKRRTDQHDVDGAAAGRRRPGRAAAAVPG